MEPIEHPDPKPSCPDCGARMQLIKPRPTSQVESPFWGCVCFFSPDRCTGRVQVDGATGLPVGKEWNTA